MCGASLYIPFSTASVWRVKSLAACLDKPELGFHAARDTTNAANAATRRLSVHVLASVVPTPAAKPLAFFNPLSFPTVKLWRLAGAEGTGLLFHHARLQSIVECSALAEKRSTKQHEIYSCVS
jgi:hypothetical protein